MKKAKFDKKHPNLNGLSGPSTNIDLVSYDYMYADYLQSKKNKDNSAVINVKDFSVYKKFYEEFKNDLANAKVSGSSSSSSSSQNAGGKTPKDDLQTKPQGDTPTTPTTPDSSSALDSSTSQDSSVNPNPQDSSTSPENPQDTSTDKTPENGWFIDPATGELVHSDTPPVDELQLIIDAIRGIDITNIPGKEGDGPFGPKPDDEPLPDIPSDPVDEPVADSSHA